MISRGRPMSVFSTQDIPINEPIIVPIPAAEASANTPSVFSTNITP